jgi:hypothetical protein
MGKQVIDLDSFHHYRVRRVLHGLEIVEYPADACPSMGDELDENAGRPIAVLKDGEEAEFVLGRFTAAIPSAVFEKDEHAKDVWCGDDFIQCLRGDWRKHQGKVVKR